MNRSIYVIYAPLKKGFFVSIDIVDDVISCVYDPDFTKARIFADKTFVDGFVVDLDDQLPDTKHHVLTVKCKL